MKTDDNTKGIPKGTTPKLAYGVAEAAKAIGLGRSTLYAMMQAGTLRFTKVGNRRLIPTDALMSLLTCGESIA